MVVTKYIKLTANWEPIFKYIHENGLLETMLEFLFVFSGAPELETQGNSYYITKGNTFSSNTKILGVIRNCKVCDNTSVLHRINNLLSDKGLNPEEFVVYEGIPHYRNGEIIAINYAEPNRENSVHKTLYCKVSQTRVMYFTFVNNKVPHEFEQLLRQCKCIFLKVKL